MGENHSEARKVIGEYVLIERTHADPVHTRIAACNATVLSRVHGRFFLPVLICILLTGQQICCSLTNDAYYGGLAELWLKISEDREGALNEVPIWNCVISDMG